MAFLLFIFGLVLGTLLGRVYGWMKYHYPEFQEAVRVKEARYRAERTKIELQIERYRAEIDDLLNERMK